MTVRPKSLPKNLPVKMFFCRGLTETMLDSIEFSIHPDMAGMGLVAGVAQRDGGFECHKEDRLFDCWQCSAP